ncbi:disease resistance protein RGA2-like [Malus sylvestris]|uniref:disease resistance protein RGA2-like n=1 Tax=Malus sylvestris TaxID=3752 RepID=UPI0021ABDE35|nr:disease resistance protein RGA2-like [Malus sylvestris]XP_050144001.1 disease resistance protein RGA2-like [Malus sylvestris]XP_050144002.1 disease resistance protein RGA2-like [Malus sylvestris]
MEAVKAFEVHTFPVEGILNKLALLAAQEFSLFRGFRKELAKFRQSIRAIQEFLGDVTNQPQQDRGMAVRDWLKKLEEVARDADNVFDEINYEDVRSKAELQNQVKKKVLNFLSRSNPILFRQQMAHKIKNINATLADLKSEASFIGLVARRIDSTLSPQGMGNRETVSSFDHDEKIFGREEIVSGIIATLIDSNNQEKYLSVMVIVGMAGLGKTTLAKSIYNDNRYIDKHFETKIWVCVSTTFDVNSILRRILELLNSTNTGLTSQEALLQNLQKELMGKRYILVLDDVWNEDDMLWSNLMSCLSKLNSAHGSVMIVTTRSVKVASITETLPRCDLVNLSVEDCWSILKGEAFPYGCAPLAASIHERIGRAIAEKCAGVPLVAKVLGSMMRSRNSANEWLVIQESKIWELPEGEDRIMSILKLSFDSLKSPYLKQCFACCSMLEKDFEIERDDLVQLWMAQGLLHSHANLEMEDIGNEYFDSLLENSFFQDVIKDGDGFIIRCKMHDLVHDLAELVSKYDGEDKLKIQSKTEISSLIPKSLEKNAEKVSSLFSHSGIPGNILSRFKGLRVLKLSKTYALELPSSIGELRHLRYLDISNTHFRALPRSVGKLYNLQTLRMYDTKQLRIFPRELENLINLRHVYFDKYMEVIPFGIRSCTLLQRLPSFTLDRARTRGIDELGGLNQLKGNLTLRCLEYVRDKEEAKKSNLVGKAYIRGLTFEWGNCGRGRNEHDDDVLEGLQLHPKLEILRIENFMGTKFASWMISGLLPQNLQEVLLYDCRECEQVPTLGHLPHLRHVVFHSMHKLKCVGAEFYGYNFVSSGATTTTRNETVRRVILFPALKTLQMIDCPVLVEWNEAVVAMPTNEKVELVVFPCLEKLTLVSCMELRTAPGHFPSLQKLDVYNVDNFMAIENISSQLTALTSLRLEYLQELTSLPVGILEKNQKLLIRGCPNLTSIPISRSPSLVEYHSSLQELSIVDCPKLRCISIHSLTTLRKLAIERCSLESTNLQSGLEELSLYGCTSLCELRIEECNGFTSILSGLQSCTSLRSFFISKCQSLKHLGRQYPVSLEHLVISRCPNLRAIPSLDNLTSLRYLEIEKCDAITSLPSELSSCISLSHFLVKFCDKIKSMADQDVSSLQSLSCLVIYECLKLQYLPRGLHSLHGLKEMTIGKFWKLDSFPDFEVPSSQIQSLTISGWRKLKSLPDQIQHFTTLTSLEIRSFGRVESLPEWLGDLTSLTQLRIKRCKNLMYFPTVEAMQRITKLHVLEIDACPHLKEACAEESGREWPKISRIPHKRFH